ncbi:MAG: LysR family transcriptional regulator [Anaerolineales bacterium]|nr:LysR family transcriptional regulator [Anaerolineales bacterium]
MEPKFNLWIEQEGVVVLSAWRVQLLQAIHVTGSISAAAEQLKVPYRRAWEKLQEMEQGLGLKLVETAVGGAGGGGARLTPAGAHAIEQFLAFAAGFEQEVVERYASAFPN